MRLGLACFPTEEADDEGGRPRANVTTIWEMAGARAHSWWPRRNAAIIVFARVARNTLQPRHEDKV
jgi:hypothetical protein